MLSGDHKHVDSEGVEAALINVSCVDYSSAGAQAGLAGGGRTEGAASLLFASVDLSCRERLGLGHSERRRIVRVFLKTAMKRLRHTVHEQCERLNLRRSRNLNGRNPTREPALGM